MLSSIGARIVMLVMAAGLCTIGSAQTDFRFSDRFALNAVAASSIGTVVAEPPSFGNRLLVGLGVNSSSGIFAWTDAAVPGFSLVPGSSSGNFGFVELGAAPGIYRLWHDSFSLLRLSRFDGTTWIQVGPHLGWNTDGRLFVIRENGVDEIYVGIHGVTNAAIGAPHILHWTGSTFVQVGPNLLSASFETTVMDLLRHDDGTGPSLVVAVTGAPPQRLVGNAWQPMANFGGASPLAIDLHVMPNGTSEELWAGGTFTVPGGSHLAKWTGSSWQPIGQPNGTVEKIIHFDGPNGREIFVAGAFTSIGGQSIDRSARLVGTTWSAIPGRQPGSKDRFVPRFVNQTPVLDVVSVFNGFATVSRWNGQTLIGPEGDGLSNAVFALARHDDGSGEKLWVGGAFRTSSAAAVEGIAVYDGESLSSPGGATIGPNSGNVLVNTLLSFRQGATSFLVAGGKFEGLETPTGFQPMKSIAAWDGTTWSPLAQGIGDQPASFAPGTVNAMAIFDGGWGAELYVGGSFGKAGNVNANNIAAWNGISWRAVGTGTNGPVNSLKVYKGQLFVGGSFTSAGSQPCNGFARSNGIGFSSVGGGLSSPFSFVNAMHVHNEGGVDRLIVGGYFTSIEGFTASSIAAWDGASWSSLGIGIADSVYPAVASITTFDEGDGPALYVGGLFSTAGAVPASRIARFKDGAWSTLGGGVTNANIVGSFVNCSVWALSPFRDPRGGESLYLGGVFGSADGVISNALAAWEADPQSSTCPVLGAAARSAVGESAGGPFDVLKVQGRVGNGHRVNVDLGEPIVIALEQPPTVPYSTGLVVYGRIGAASTSEAFTLPFGLGEFAFTPCSFDPTDGSLFVLASDFAPGCPPLAPAGGTPWSLSIPGGIGFPFDFTLQGFVGDLSAPFGISKTNAVLVVVR